MATLKQYLLEIKRQKDTYLLPENLKKDVSRRSLSQSSFTKG